MLFKSTAVAARTCTTTIRFDDCGKPVIVIEG